MFEPKIYLTVIAYSSFLALNVEQVKMTIFITILNCLILISVLNLDYGTRSVIK